MADTEKVDNVKEIAKSPRVDTLKKSIEDEKIVLEKELKQYREFYEKHVNDPKYLEAKSKIKELSAKIGPLNNELAQIARSKGSKGIKVEAGEFSSEGK